MHSKPMNKNKQRIGRKASHHFKEELSTQIGRY
jgi:hypothetical protein